MRINQPDDDKNERLDQELLHTDIVQLEEVPLPSPAYPPDEYESSKDHEDKAKFVISRIHTKRRPERKSKTNSTYYYTV